ncbi:hypothetical protein K491DRAFT_197180 [Lophiostoma macrostomum CBS 122681]|uniref:Uncharacterized protein n=1 Tax=Lophiostoma macrostomum CBS 122681 TaxID=1314788 RepID=A0A6A6SRG0_9PLEO|nr:hypothetical protein K491DRAFT_197180 [Lophiostoma macrostomum CBS 122681]
MRVEVRYLHFGNCREPGGEAQRRMPVARHVQGLFERLWSLSIIHEVSRHGMCKRDAGKRLDAEGEITSGPIHLIPKRPPAPARIFQGSTPQHRSADQESLVGPFVLLAPRLDCSLEGVRVTSGQSAPNRSLPLAPKQRSSTGRLTAKSTSDGGRDSFQHPRGAPPASISM